MRVIAKAYGGEPLDRILTGRANGLAYVINPSAVDSGDIAEFSGVGFPLDAVFAHNSCLIEMLRDAWEKGDSRELDRLWRGVEPLTTDA